MDLCLSGLSYATYLHEISMLSVLISKYFHGELPVKVTWLKGEEGSAVGGQLILWLKESDWEGTEGGNKYISVAGV